jgi:hypothetical protein
MGGFYPASLSKRTRGRVGPRHASRNGCLIWLKILPDARRIIAAVVMEQAMSGMEAVFLGLVIFAFTLFGVTVAWANWYERSWAAKKTGTGTWDKKAIANESVDWPRAA